MSAICPGVALAMAALGSVSAAEPDYTGPEKNARILSAEIREASGLAVSTRNDGFLWLINDSGSPAAIHLIDGNGSSRGKVTVEGARNIDWEDLASFTLAGESWLLAADTGDNDSKRESCTLYILREPEPPAAGVMLDAKVPIAWKIDFRFDGGPRDCEAVAVDAKAGKILLLSKRTSPPELHELPLKPADASAIQSTRRLGPVDVSAPVDGRIPFRNQPTGLDISADDSLAAVVTYYGVFVFTRGTGDDWRQAFSSKPRILPPHCLPQAEAVAFTKRGGDIVVASEGKNTPIAIYRKSGS